MADQETYDRTLDQPSEPGLQPDQTPARVPDEAYYRTPNAPVRRGNRQVIGIALLVIGLLWLLMAGRNGPWFGGGPLGAGRTLADETFTAQRLVVDIPTGDVNVQIWGEPTMRVEALYRGGSPDDYAISIDDSSSGTVAITGGPKPWALFGPSRDVEYRISVPANADVRIKTVNGDIVAAGAGGEVALETTNGDITASELANGLVASTVNGQIELNGVGGELRANSTNGDILVEQSTGTRAHVETINGDIHVDGATGELELISTSGEISVQDAAARLTASTTNGDIDYEGSLAGDGGSTVNSISGDVQLSLPEDSSFTLQVDTVSGDIDNDFELQNRQEARRSLSGSVGTNGPTLKIDTINGDVRIERG